MPHKHATKDPLSINLHAAVAIAFYFCSIPFSTL